MYILIIVEVLFSFFPVKCYLNNDEAKVLKLFN